MNRVYGRVLSRESGAGLADLVVAIFHADPGNDNAPANVPAAQPVLQRIGSVLTGDRGEFEILFELEEFKAADADARPDLVLMVFAPEDVADAATCSSVAPEARILIRSSIPRQDAGRTEAYVLRIEDAVLRKHGISARPTHTDSVASAVVSVVQAANSGEQVKTGIRNALRSARRSTLSNLRLRSNAGRRFAGSLSAIPRNARTTAQFIHKGDDLAAAQHLAMQSSLPRLSDATERGVVFYARDEAFRDLGVRPPRLDSEVIEVDEETICRLTRRNRAGIALGAVTSLLEQHRREAQARARLSAPADEHDGEEPDDGATSADDAISDREYLRRAVRQQLADLSVPPPRPAASMRELTERLVGLRLPPGTTEVTAVRDVNGLQVAFRQCPSGKGA